MTSVGTYNNYMNLSLQQLFLKRHFNGESFLDTTCHFTHISTYRSFLFKYLLPIVLFRISTMSCWSKYSKNNHWFFVEVSLQDNRTYCRLSTTVCKFVDKCSK